MDGAHLRIQGKRFYDFTLHFMEVKDKGPFYGVQFVIRNFTLLLVEGTDQTNARNIQNCLNSALVQKHETRLDQFMHGFSMVTDGAAVMAWVANASVSHDIHVPDESWMSCMAHCSNNAMKSVIATYCEGTILQIVVQDFRSMKRIIEDANRSGWNHLLPDGYKLIPESETRFGTFYVVAERFLKSAHFASNMLDSHLRSSARSSYVSLKKTSNIDGIINGFSGIKAVFDGFGVLVDCIERFESSERPTLHIALPTVYRILEKFDDVSHGKRVWRGKDWRLHIS